MIRAKNAETYLPGVFALLLIFIYLFKLIYLRPIAKQVIPTYIYHSRPLISDGIHHFFFSFFFERGLRGERSHPCPYMLSA